MQVTVKGANCDVPDRIKREASEKLSGVRKLFDRFIDMDVVFHEEHNPRIQERIRVEVVLHAKGKYLRAEAHGKDFMTAIDRAEAKLARQVRKYKTKVVKHGRERTAEINAEINAKINRGEIIVDA